MNLPKTPKRRKQTPQVKSILEIWGVYKTRIGRSYKHMQEPTTNGTHLAIVKRSLTREQQIRLRDFKKESSKRSFRVKVIFRSSLNWLHLNARMFRPLHNLSFLVDVINNLYSVVKQQFLMEVEDHKKYNRNMTHSYLKAERNLVAVKNAFYEIVVQGSTVWARRQIEQEKGIFAREERLAIQQDFDVERMTKSEFEEEKKKNERQNKKKFGRKEGPMRVENDPEDEPQPIEEERPEGEEGEEEEIEYVQIFKKKNKQKLAFEASPIHKPRHLENEYIYIYHQLKQKKFRQFEMLENDFSMLLEPDQDHFDTINYTNGEPVEYMQQYQTLSFPEEHLDKIFYFFFQHNNNCIEHLTRFLKSNIFEKGEFKNIKIDSYSTQITREREKSGAFMHRLVFIVSKVMRGLFLTSNGYLALSIFNYLADIYKDSITTKTQKSTSTYYYNEPKVEMKLSNQILSSLDHNKLREKSLGQSEGSGEDGGRRVIGNYHFKKRVFREKMSDIFKNMNFLEALIYNLRTETFLLDFNYECNKFFIEKMNDTKYRKNLEDTEASKEMSERTSSFDFESVNFKFLKHFVMPDIYMANTSKIRNNIQTIMQEELAPDLAEFFRFYDRVIEQQRIMKSKFDIKDQQTLVKDEISKFLLQSSEHYQQGLNLLDKAISFKSNVAFDPINSVSTPRFRTNGEGDEKLEVIKKKKVESTNSWERDDSYEKKEAQKRNLKRTRLATLKKKLRRSIPKDQLGTVLLFQQLEKNFPEKEYKIKLSGEKLEFIESMLGIMQKVVRYGLTGNVEQIRRDLIKLENKEYYITDELNSSDDDLGFGAGDNDQFGGYDRYDKFSSLSKRNRFGGGGRGFSGMFGGFGGGRRFKRPVKKNNVIEILKKRKQDSYVDDSQLASMFNKLSNLGYESLAFFRLCFNYDHLLTHQKTADILIQKMANYIRISSYSFKSMGKVLKIFQDKIKLIMKQTEPYRERFNLIKRKQPHYQCKENRQKAVEILKTLKLTIESKESLVTQMVNYKEQLFVLIFNSMYNRVFEDKDSTERVSDHVKRCLIQDNIMDHMIEFLHFMGYGPKIVDLFHLTQDSFVRNKYFRNQYYQPPGHRLDKPFMQIIYHNTRYGTFFDKLYSLMNDYLNQKISVGNFALLAQAENLDKVKKLFIYFFKKEQLGNFDNYFVQFKAKYDDSTEFLEFFDRFLEIDFVKNCLAYQDLLSEIAKFKDDIVKEPILQIRFPYKFTEIKKEYISLMPSTIFQNIINRSFFQSSSLPKDEQERLSFGELSFTSLVKLLEQSSEFLDQLVEYSENTKLKKSISLADLQEIFDQVDIFKELKIFKRRYDKNMEPLFRLFGKMRFVQKALRFGTKYNEIYEFLGLKDLEGTEQLKKLITFHEKQGDQTNFHQLEKIYDKLRKFKTKDEDFEVPELKTNLELRKVNPLFLLIENHVNIIYFLEVMSENIELMNFLMEIYKKFLDSFDSKIDILNEEIQSGDYSIKTVHLNDCKHLIRHLKEVSAKNFNSDARMLMFFLEKNIVEGKMRLDLMPSKETNVYPNHLRLHNEFHRNPIFHNLYDKHTNRDIYEGKYQSKRFMYSSYNCAMLRVKILNLIDVHLELKTLYKRSIDVYQQSLELIQSIMKDSRIRFSCQRIDNIQIEITKFIFEIVREGESKGESALKISDLYSRSLIRKEQSADAGIEFTLFIDLFRYLKNTLDIFKKCWNLGFDIESDFLNVNVMIKNNNLDKVKNYYQKLKNYYEDLSSFVEDKRSLREYYFLNYMSGQQIRAIDDQNLEGMFHFLKWWDTHDAKEDDDQETPFDPTHFGSKYAENSEQLVQIQDQSAQFQSLISSQEKKFDKQIKKAKKLKWQGKSFKQRVEQLRKCFEFLQTPSQFVDFPSYNREKFDVLNKMLVIRTQNYFKAMVSLFNETSTTIPKLHQLLFCSTETTSVEAQTFVLRCLNDPLKRLFCIIGFDKLSYSVSKTILSTISDHIKLYKKLQKEPKNTPAEFYLALLQTKGNQTLKDSSNIAKKYEIQKEANDGFLSEYGTYVTSDGPGMGKSRYIEQHARHKKPHIRDSFFSLMLTGKMSDYKLKNLGSHLLALKDSSELDLHVKLSYFTNINDADYLISSFLFKLTYLKMLENKHTFTKVGKQCQVFVEVGNSFNNFLEHSIRVLSLLRKRHISDFNLQNYEYDESNFAKDDYCFNYIYLKHIKDNSLNNKNMFINHKDSLGNVNLNRILYLKGYKKMRNFGSLSAVSFKKDKYGPQEAEDLYNDFFLNSPHRNKKNRMSYSKFKLFLKILREQITSFLFMKMLFPKNLSASKISMRHWRIHILNTMINSIIEFLNSNVAILSSQNSAIQMADQLSVMDKQKMQSQLVTEFQKRMNCIEKWEDKNPITVQLLRDRIFLSIKNVDKLVQSEKDFKKMKKTRKSGGNKEGVADPEAEEEEFKKLEYLNNVLAMLNIYEVPTRDKPLNIMNPKFNPDPTVESTEPEFHEFRIKEKSNSAGVIDLENLGTESFLYRLIGLTGRRDITLEQLIFQSRIFENKGYEINLDNFLKIVLILQRAHLRVPVVCIGETGCGKTFMIKYISQVLMNVKEFKHLTLHTGYTELEMKNFISDLVVRARKAHEIKKIILEEIDELKLKKYKARGKRSMFNAKEKERLRELKKQADQSDEYWVFFDEFNTSVLQNYICEIMIERVCSLLPYDPVYGQKIPENMVFLAAANPYRLRNRDMNEGIIHPSAKTLLSHMVNPIPENVLDYVWDYGVLEPGVEKVYIKGMVVSKEVFQEKIYEEAFVECISIGQKQMRNVEEGDNSSVSLRDLQRTMKICKFFQKFLSERLCPQEDLLSMVGTFSYWAYATNPLKKAIYNGNPLKDRREIVLRSMVLTLAICYLFRLCNKVNKENLIEEFITVINRFFAEGGRVYNKAWFEETIRDEQDDYLYRIKGINKLPNDIAMNRSLKENVMTILVCILNKIPLFICGKPGSSKTQSFQILKSVMKGISIDETLFSELPEINESYYQGTLHSTSEGIENLFRKAQENARDNENRNILTVFFFDEIGLAEISKNNPLKVLHNLLEEKDMLVSFVGISNWTLDASKMNRAVYLARWDLDLADLIEICEQFGTLNSNLMKTNPSPLQLQDKKDKNVDQANEIFRDFKRIISQTYLKFREYQNKKYLHKNFHGTRDFYSLMKFLFRNVRFPKPKDPNFERDSLTRLLSVLKKAFERNFSGGYDTDAKNSEIEIKQIFIEEMDRISGFNLEDLGFKVSEFLQTEQKLDIVRDSLVDMKGRFLLVFIDSDFVEQQVEKIVRETSAKGKVHFLCGSKLDADILDNKYSTEILKDIKLYIEEGYTIIMKDLDMIYGALYDLFNQNYLTVNEKSFCRITFENHKESVAIHEDFRLIILQKSQSEIEDIETSQPAPFLNRFEKLNINYSDIAPVTVRKSVQFVQEKLKVNLSLAELINEPNLDALVYDFSEMMCINRTMEHYQQFSQTEVDFDSEEYSGYDKHFSKKEIQIGEGCIKSLMPLYTFQMFLIEYNRLKNETEKNELISEFIQNHKFNNLQDFLTQSKIPRDHPLVHVSIAASEERALHESQIIQETVINNMLSGIQTEEQQEKKEDRICVFQKSIIFTKSNFMDFRTKLDAESIRLEELNKEGKSWFENKVVTFLNDPSAKDELIVFVENYEYWKNIPMLRHLVNQVEKKVGVTSFNTNKRYPESPHWTSVQTQTAQSVARKHIIMVIHYNEKLSSNKVFGSGKAQCLWQEYEGWKSYAIDSLNNCNFKNKIDDFKTEDVSRTDKHDPVQNKKDLSSALEASCLIFNYDMDLKSSLKYVNELRVFYSRHDLGKKLFLNLFEKANQVTESGRENWRKAVIENFAEYGEEIFPQDIYRMILKKKTRSLCKKFLQDLDLNSPLGTIKKLTNDQRLVSSSEKETLESQIITGLYTQIFRETTLNMIQFQLEDMFKSHEKKVISLNSVYDLQIPFIKKYCSLFVRNTKDLVGDEIKNINLDAPKGIENLNKIYGKIQQKFLEQGIFSNLVKYFREDSIREQIQKAGVHQARQVETHLREIQKTILLDLISDTCNLVLGDGRNYTYSKEVKKVLLFLVKKVANYSQALWISSEASKNDAGQDELIKTFIYFVMFLVKKKDEVNMVLNIISHCREEDLQKAFSQKIMDKPSASMSQTGLFLFIQEGVLNMMVQFLKMYLPPLENFYIFQKTDFVLKGKQIKAEKILLIKIKKFYSEKQRQQALLNQLASNSQRETRVVGTFITPDPDKMEVLMDYMIFLLDVIHMDLKNKIKDDVETLVLSFFKKIKQNRSQNIVNIFFEPCEYFISDDDILFDKKMNPILEDSNDKKATTRTKKRHRSTKFVSQTWAYVLFRILQKKFLSQQNMIKKFKIHVRATEYTAESCIKKNCNFLVQSMLYELKVNQLSDQLFFKRCLRQVIAQEPLFTENLNLLVQYFIETLNSDRATILIEILNSEFKKIPANSIFQTILIDKLTERSDMVKALVKLCKKMKPLYKFRKIEKVLEHFIVQTVDRFDSFKPFEKILCISDLRARLYTARDKLFPWIENKKGFASLDKFFLQSTKKFSVFSPLKTFFVQNLNDIKDVFSYSNPLKRKIIPMRILSDYNFDVYSVFPDTHTNYNQSLYQAQIEDEQKLLEIVLDLTVSNNLRQYLILEFLINKIYLTHVKSQQHSDSTKENFQENIKSSIPKITSDPIKELVKNLFMNFPNNTNLQISSDMNINEIQRRLLIVKMMSSIVTLRNNDHDLFNSFVKTIRNNDKSQNHFFLFNFNEKAEDDIGFLFGLSAAGATAFYTCSCSYIYGIGNCGQAWVESKCPSCGLTIGGKSHNLNKREGHHKIDETFISNKYKGSLMKYAIQYYDHATLPTQKHAGEKKKTLMDGFMFRVMHLYVHVFYLACLNLFKGQGGNKKLLSKLVKNQKSKGPKLKSEQKFSLVSNNFMQHIEADLRYLRGYLNLSEVPYDYFCSLVFPIRQAHLENNGSIQDAALGKFMKFISSGTLQKMILFEKFMGEKVKETLEHFQETKGQIDKFKNNLQKDKAKNESFRNDWILSKATFDKVVGMKKSQTDFANNPMLVWNLRITRRFDFNDFTTELEERTGNEKYLFLKHYIKHKELVDGVMGEILDLHLKISNHFHEKYPFCFTKEHLRFLKIKHLVEKTSRKKLMEDPDLKNFEDAIETILLIKKQKNMEQDLKLGEMYNMFAKLWIRILQLQEKYEDVFNFNFECHQGVEVGVNKSKLENKEINLMYFTVITNSEELNMMLVIFQTCAKFQNKIIEEYLAPEGSDVFIEDVPLAYAQNNDFLALEPDYLQDLFELYAFNDPSFNNGRRVNFNFRKIEEILKTKLNQRCKRLLYSREHLESYPVKGEVDEITKLMNDLQTVVKAKKLPEDAETKIDGMSMNEVRLVEDEIGKVLFYVLRSGIRNPDMELKKFIYKNDLELVSSLGDLSLDLGMLYDLHKRTQLKISFWKINNQIHGMYKVPLEEDEIDDFKRFKDKLPGEFRKRLTEYMRLYMSQKTKDPDTKMLDLNLFEFMSYAELELIDITCWGDEEVTLDLPQDGDNADADAIRHEPVVYKFKKIYNHSQIFEILRLLEA